ncbi:hypothetical protein [Weissella viridescens]|uniref:hypothetical protein n=1 Tax=Weissella viridescens TaxID=1629 RepID=UPI001C7D32C3|nr:hypothetical protein [Weissella viridescens]MBX4172884.1 hypothetical protein [Weissella viridescens]
MRILLVAIISTLASILPGGWMTVFAFTFLHNWILKIFRFVFLGNKYVAFSLDQTGEHELTLKNSGTEEITDVALQVKDAKHNKIANEDLLDFKPGDTVKITIDAEIKNTEYVEAEYLYKKHTRHKRVFMPMYNKYKHQQQKAKRAAKKQAKSN